MENNLYYTSGKPVTRWLIRDFLQTFEEHQRTMGLDKNSVFAKPEFLDPVRHDYRLKPGSVGEGG
jgi:hypothetical protein